MPELVNGPRAHVLLPHGRDQSYVATLKHAISHQKFRGENEVGRTEHLIVYSDGSSQGDASAKAVLASAEADYAAVQDWFGGIALPAGQQGDDQNVPRTATPIQVLMDPQAGGAYHFGCNATDLYIEPNPQLASGFMVAELVEVFEAAANNGWDCGHANGECLSRALAGARNPALVADLLQTEQAWWAHGHADFITNNAADDQNEDSNGCGTLFLYYLHSQLNFTWRQISTTGGDSLGACYQKLTGKDPAQGFRDFVSLVATLDQGGQLNLPQSGNPFPLAGSAQPAPASPQTGTSDSPDLSGAVSAVESGLAAASKSGNLLWVVLAVVLVVLIVAGVLVATGVVVL